MQVTDNTILITGGGSGIGRALAEAFHRLGNRVIVAGRRRAALDAVAQANPGIETAVLDVQDPADIARFAREAEQRYPSLNVVIHSAGIMKHENWTVEGADAAIAETTIATNLLAPIRLTAALLPQLKRRPRSTVITVTSGLAYLTLAATPTYCATKAAIHAFGEALRFQLQEQGSPVEVIEIAPPYVQTELMGAQQAVDPRAMPLAEFTAEVMEILSTQPQVQEVLVKRVLPLRFAGAQGYDKYQEQFLGFNRAFMADPHGE
jgi:uncharacterized oxidoreductase